MGEGVVVVGGWEMARGMELVSRVVERVVGGLGVGAVAVCWVVVSLAFSSQAAREAGSTGHVGLSEAWEAMIGGMGGEV